MKFVERKVRLLVLVVVTTHVTGCTIKAEFTTQRTALENQVMGSYKELEDDLVLLSAVRSPSSAAAVSPSRRRALDARQNQDFNRDDIDELKTLGVLGETNAGTVVRLSQAGKLGADSPYDERLVASLIDEENRDRQVIWQRIIDGNPNLSLKDLPDVRQTYAKLQRSSAGPGHWYQDEQGKWIQQERKNR